MFSKWYLHTIPVYIGGVQSNKYCISNIIYIIINVVNDHNDCYKHFFVGIISALIY